MTILSPSNELNYNVGDVITTLTTEELNARGLVNGQTWRWVFLEREFFPSYRDEDLHADKDIDITCSWRTVRSIGIVSNDVKDGLVEYGPHTSHQSLVEDIRKLLTEFFEVRSIEPVFVNDADLATVLDEPKRKAFLRGVMPWLKTDKPDKADQSD